MADQAFSNQTVIESVVGTPQPQPSQEPVISSVTAPPSQQPPSPEPVIGEITAGRPSPKNTEPPQQAPRSVAEDITAPIKGTEPPKNAADDIFAPPLPRKEAIEEITKPQASNLEETLRSLGKSLNGSGVQHSTDRHVELAANEQFVAPPTRSVAVSGSKEISVA